MDVITCYKSVISILLHGVISLTCDKYCLFWLFQDFPSPLKSPPDFVPPPPVTVTEPTPDTELPPASPLYNGSGKYLYFLPAVCW